MGKKALPQPRDYGITPRGVPHGPRPKPVPYARPRRRPRRRLVLLVVLVAISGVLAAGVLLLALFG